MNAMRVLTACVAGVLAGIPAQAASAEGVFLPLPVRVHEGSIAQVDRFQTALIWGNWHDLAPTEEPFTELVLVAKNGSFSKSRVQGIRGNRISPLGEDRLLLGGASREADGSEELAYGYRVLERRGSEWKQTWSSSDLPVAWRPGEEFPKFRHDGNGKWSLINVTRPRVLEFAFGSFTGSAIEGTAAYEFSAEEISDRNRFLSDLEIEYLPTAKGDLFLVSADGKAWILDPTLGRRTNLTDVAGRYPRGVYDPQRGLLWLTSKNGWVAYDTADFLGARTRDALETVPRYELTNAAVGFRVDNVCPGKDGLIAIGKSTKLESLRFEVGDSSVIAPVSPRAMLLHPVEANSSPQAKEKWITPELIPPLEYWPKLKPGAQPSEQQLQSSRKAAMSALHQEFQGTAIALSSDGATVAAIEAATGPDGKSGVRLYRYDISD